MADLPPESEELKKVFGYMLDIPNIEVENVERDRDGHFKVTVKSTENGTRCHRCGRVTTKRYGYAPAIELRHLPVFGQQVYLRIKPVRYQCQYCSDKPTTTQKLSWYMPRSPHTIAFERSILLACINSTVWDVSMKIGIGYEAVMGIFDRHIQKKIEWANARRLEVIGIDEISLKKGHQDYVVIVTSREGNQTQLLGVLQGRKKEAVKAFFLSIPKRLRKQVQAVCSDMYDGFIAAAREVFGKRVQIVVDRFHVAKHYRSSLDTLRKQELKRLKKLLSKEEYKEFKGVMWLLRKNKRDLVEEEQRILDKIFSHSPKLQQAYDFCDELTAIFNATTNKRHGTQRINGWIRRVQKSDLVCFAGFIKTLKRYKDEICNYFRARNTSGFVEGLNNKIKVIKRRCYGILNIEHLFQRLHLDLTGYSRYV